MTATAKTCKRKEVKTHKVRDTFWGPVYFIRIEFMDGRISYGVSSPDGMHLIGNQREKAWKLANETKVYGMSTVPR